MRQPESKPARTRTKGISTEWELASPPSPTVTLTQSLCQIPGIGQSLTPTKIAVEMKGMEVIFERHHNFSCDPPQTRVCPYTTDRRTAAELVNTFPAICKPLLPNKENPKRKRGVLPICLGNTCSSFFHLPRGVPDSGAGYRSLSPCSGGCQLLPQSQLPFLKQPPA